MEIKDIIKSARLSQKMTMKELSEKIGVSEATISRWESGDIENMRRDKISLLSKVLDISLPVLVGWDHSVDQGNNSISSNSSSRDITNTTTTNNFFSQKQSCGNRTLTTADSKNYFFAIIDNLRGMDDSSLRDVLKYTQFILSKQEDEK